MVVECISISAILLAIFFIFVRSNKKKTALATLPLMIVPILHLAGIPLSRWLDHIMPYNRASIYIIIDLVALVAACITLGIMANGFHSKKTRVVYLGVSGLFTTILSCILIFNLSV